jgi:hypothetical protein
MQMACRTDYPLMTVVLPVYTPGKPKPALADNPENGSGENMAHYRNGWPMLDPHFVQVRG